MSEPARTWNAVEFDRVGVAYPPTFAPSLKEMVVGMFRRRGERAPFWALRNLTFELAAGVSVGIVGENGAGKSTLLRVTAGIVPPAAGEALVRGTVAPLIELGTGFDVELTGRENVLFNGALLGRDRAAMLERLPEIIEFSGLRESIDAPLRTYSTGMVARLAFSIATTVDADIVLLDEILSVGDAQFHERCEERIRAYYESGATVLLVSHDLKSIRDLCSRSLWIREGRIFADGPSGEVIDEYLAFLRGGRRETRSATGQERSLRPDPPSARSGTTVVLRGRRFESGTRVLIGGEQAEIQDLTPDSVTILVPDLLPGGAYDLVVQSGSDSERVEKGFFADYDDLVPSSPCHAAVNRLVRRGILVPRGGSSFGPATPLTWEELKRILPEAAGLAAIPGEGSLRGDDAVTRGAVAPVFVAIRHGRDYVPPPAEGIFEDVPPTEVGSRYVEQLYRDRIAAGVSRKPMLFGAQEPLTRCQFAALLDQALGG